MIPYQKLLLDPAPNGGGFPDISNGQLTTIRLDETDHNRPVETPTEAAPDKNILSFDDVVAPSTKRGDGFDKLPANTSTKPTTNRPQKFEEKAHEEAAVKDQGGVDDPPEEEVDVAADEARRAEEAAKSPVKPAKPVAEVAKEEKAEEVAAKEPEAAAPPKGRDYTGLDAEDVKVLKGSNNYHYNKFTPILRKYVAKAAEGEAAKAKLAEMERTLTEKGVPPQWIDHPDAYQLTPQYREIATVTTKLSQEKSFYEEQLVNCYEGKAILDILSYDQSGQPVYSAPRNPTNPDLVKIQGLIGEYNSVISNQQGRLGALQTMFRNEHKTAADSVVNTVKQYISQVIPELKPTDEVIKPFREAIPAAFKGHPMTFTAEQLYGLVIKQAQMIQSLQTKQTTQARVANDRKEAGVKTTEKPRGTSTSSGTTIKLPSGRVVPKTFDFAEFTS